jgi:U3 small nucleolar ribonucleoprotein component
MIKQRILDDAYDDRQKVEFSETFRENFNNLIEISKEKSKLSLTE